MKIICYLFTVVFSISVYAQERFMDSVFRDIDRKTLTYYDKIDEKLKLDIFYPAEDPMEGRPLLLYVHGGGFAGGERDHPNHMAFCRKMASKGYVTATMSYTLQMKGKSFGCDRPSPEKIQTFLLTAQDISRATDHLISRKEEFAIDPEKIVLLGSSAGAEAIMHAAYWRETYKDIERQILPNSFKYAGVVSMAGAITFDEWITEETAIPTQLFHGTCDNLVPYGYAPHHYCDASDPGYLMLHGAYSVAKRLKSLGKGFYLVTGCFGRHEWNSTPLTEHLDRITDFLYYDVMKGRKRQIHEILDSKYETGCSDYNSFNFCEN